MLSLSCISYTCFSLVIHCFPVIHICADTKQQSRHVVTLLFLTTYILFPITSLLLFIHLFLSILSFLPANYCCTKPIISPAEVFAGPPLQRLETHVFRPPGCLRKKIPTHPVPPAGPVQPNRGFWHTDDGAHSSFLNPHKSVDGFCPVV